jgi:cell pole-organizing protein PopZ
MRQNVPIDEILDSLKKMMDNKSSRISKYLVAENNYDESLDQNNEDDEILELTEEAIIFESNKVSNVKNFNNIDEEKKDIVKVDTAKVSDKTSSEASMYLKYLSDKSAVIKNSKEKTINEFIKEAAMPYVIDWLDKNLNKIVKEMVEKEIKRITSDDK